MSPLDQLTLPTPPPAAPAIPNAMPQGNFSQPILATAVTGAVPSPPAKSSNLGFLSVFGSTFITIFLAEIGDKTQFATLLLAAQSHQPGIVFVGAAMALVATSLVGVLIGRWLCQNLSPQALEKATGLIMLFIAIGLIIDIVQM
jgi:putative Ca2+/H+ antiporter (TMEM165/GDT1 family)